MTEYTERRIIVLREALAGAANQAAKLVDTEGGERTFDVPLYDQFGGTIAYWCNWAMKPNEVTGLESLFAARSLNGEVVVSPPDFNVKVSAPALVFDTAEWNPEEILEVLTQADSELDMVATSSSGLLL
jgi:hypothetical protein